LSRRIAVSPRGTELYAACLVDRQQFTLDSLARRPQELGTRQLTPRVLETMRRRSDLGVHKRCPKRIVHPGEFYGKPFKTVERIDIAEKLRSQTLVIQDRFGETGRAGVLRKPCPCAAARAFQVYRSDVSIGRQGTGMVKLHGHGNVRMAKPAVAIAAPQT
jgi:hypothetical protein